VFFFNNPIFLHAFGKRYDLPVPLYLFVLGGAIGLAVGGRVRPETLGAGAAIWAILAMVLSLFAGGYVTSHCSVGENRFEAVLYGVNRAASRGVVRSAPRWGDAWRRAAPGSAPSTD